MRLLVLAMFLLLTIDGRLYMLFKAVKENDGTYSIRQSRCGASWEVIMLGVRGCNVERVLNRLYCEFGEST